MTLEMDDDPVLGLSTTDGSVFHHQHHQHHHHIAVLYKRTSSHKPPRPYIIKSALLTALGWWTTTFEYRALSRSGLGRRYLTRQAMEQSAAKEVEIKRGDDRSEEIRWKEEKRMVIDDGVRLM